MQTNEKIVDRIRKLLELAKSDNVNEAASAASAAQRLMAEHRIEVAMLDVGRDAPDEEIETALLHSTGGQKVVHWQGSLAVHICHANGCATYWAGGLGSARTLQIVGTPSDAATCRYLFAYLLREIERLSKVEAAKLPGAPGRTWHTSFKLGAVSVIGSRLGEAARAEREHQRELAAASDRVQGTSTALVLVTNALAKLDTRQERARARLVGMRKTKSSSRRFDYNGYEAGKRAGATLNLSSGPALGRGTDRLR